MRRYSALLAPEQGDTSESTLNFSGPTEFFDSGILGGEHPGGSFLPYSISTVNGSSFPNLSLPLRETQQLGRLPSLSIGPRFEDGNPVGKNLAWDEFQRLRVAAVFVSR